MFEVILNAWVAEQLRDIETLQRSILIQQNKADESLSTLKKESALVLKKVDELNHALSGKIRYISPELERAVKAVAARAISIDEQVPDNENTRKEGK